MSKIIYKPAKTANDLLSMIKRDSDKAESVRKGVQVTAVAVLLHAYHHGDYTFATKHVNALGDGINAAALVEFYATFGGLEVDEETGEFCGWLGKAHIKENIEGAKSTMWWSLRKQNPWKGYDLDAQLLKVVKGLGNAQKKVEDMEELSSLVSIQVSSATKQAVLHSMGLTMADVKALVPEKQPTSKERKEKQPTSKERKEKLITAKG